MRRCSSARPAFFIDKNITPERSDDNLTIFIKIQFEAVVNYMLERIALDGGPERILINIIKSQGMFQGLRASDDTRSPIFNQASPPISIATPFPEWVKADRDDNDDIHLVNMWN